MDGEKEEKRRQKEEGTAIYTLSLLHSTVQRWQVFTSPFDKVAGGGGQENEDLEDVAPQAEMRLSSHHASTTMGGGGIARPLFDRSRFAECRCGFVESERGLCCFTIMIDRRSLRRF